MKPTNLLLNKIKKLKSINNEESLRFELYSIFSYLLFSKELFAKNKDINEFIGMVNIPLKQYVLKSRTLVVAKVLRNVNTVDANSLEFYKNQLINYFTEEETEEETEKNDKKAVIDDNNNYMKSLLEKYSRNK